MTTRVCTPRVMPVEWEATVRRRSIEANPDNARFVRDVERAVPGARRGLRRLAVVVGNRWPASKTVLSVQFLDQPSQALRRKLLAHMNAWNRTVNIRFEETAGTGEVRVARYDTPAEVAGYWSWVGTEVLAIPEEEPTMNLEGFTMKTVESEFRRVVRHEAGHTLGFDHEHMRSDLVARIDRKKAIAYFAKTQHWTAQEVDEQVLTPLKAKSIMGTTEADPHSIMCYQIPGEITKDGKPIAGGLDINEKDYAFAGTVYPKATPKADTTASATAEGASPATASASSVGSVGAARSDADTFSIVVMDETDGEPKILPTEQEHRPAYARVYATYSGAQVVTRLQLRSEGDAKTAWGRIIATHERIKKYTNRQEGDLPEDDDLRRFGSDLFETLMHGDVLRLYDEARSRQQDRKLDIVLTSMISWVAEKPWEFAYDSKRQSYLATEDVNLVRNVVTNIPSYVPPPQSGPLRILVVAAQPVGLGRLSVEQEIDVIRRGFEPSVEAGQVVVDVLPRATPGRLHGKLSTARFDVVHFIGHGSYDEELKEGALYFEDDRGNEVPLGVRSLREVFCRRGVSLLFLNSCQSGSGDRKDFNLGVAQSLVAHGMPAVVANQYSVLDTSATSFAQHFYWCLAQGMSLGQSACEARIAVNYSAGSDIIDWAVPVLFTRAPGLRICSPPAKPGSGTPATSVSRSRRQAIRNHAVRVAVWDVDSAFPDIESSLARMNDAQSVFGFEPVSLSIPIRAWDVNTKSPDQMPYLWAERLVKQVKRILPELRVDLLVCFTSHWLRDNEVVNLFAWWGGGSISIFSCAGLNLAPSGEATDRAISNVLVSLLAGSRGDLGSHTTGGRRCPLYYNENRDSSLITGEQRFDDTCREELRRRLPGKDTELAALEALLRVVV